MGCLPDRGPGRYDQIRLLIPFVHVYRPILRIGTDQVDGTKNAGAEWSQPPQTARFWPLASDVYGHLVMLARACSPHSSWCQGGSAPGRETVMAETRAANVMENLSSSADMNSSVFLSSRPH